MPLKPIHSSQLKSIKPPTPISKDTHLISRGFNVIYGPSGSYKSFYALSQAAAIAVHMPVWYVAAEGLAGMNARFQAWCEYYQAKPDNLWFIGEEVNLLSLASVNELGELIHGQTKKAGLIVFDTYARCMIGGDENSTKDTGLVIYHCTILQRKLRSAILLIHHTNKGQGSERGSSALRGGADLMIEIGNGENLINVVCSKLKDGAAWLPEQYKFHEIGDSGVLLPAVMIADRGELLPAERAILELLSESIFSESGCQLEHLRSLNLSDSRLFKILSRSKKLGRISHGSKGTPYRITELGRKVLSGELPFDFEVGKVMENETVN